MNSSRPAQWVAVIYAPNRWGPIKVFGPFRTMSEVTAWRKENRAGHMELAPMWSAESVSEWSPVGVDPPGDLDV